MTPDVNGSIGECLSCAGPLNVREDDLTPELCSLCVKSGPGPKGYRRPLIALRENEVLIACPACSYRIAFAMC